MHPVSFPRFSGIEIRDVKHLEDAGPRPLSTLEINLTDEELGLKPNPILTDRFYLTRRADNGKLQAISLGHAPSGMSGPFELTKAQTRPLIDALDRPDLVTVQPGVDAGKYEKAKANLRDGILA